MEISGSFSNYLSRMLGTPRISLNNLKTGLRFPCLSLLFISLFICCLSNKIGNDEELIQSGSITYNQIVPSNVMNGVLTSTGKNSQKACKVN